MPRTTDLARGTLPHSTVHLLGRGYQPVPAETDHTGLTVRGTLPSQLDGTFLRIGPNTRGAHDPPSTTPWGATAWCTRSGWRRRARCRTATAGCGPTRSAARSTNCPLPGPVTDRTTTSTRTSSGTPAAPWPWPPPPLCRSSSTPASPPAPARTDFDGTLPRGFCAHPLTDPVTAANSSRSATDHARDKGGSVHPRSRGPGPRNAADPGQGPSLDALLLPHRTPRRPLRPAGDPRPRRGAGRPPLPYSWQHDHGAGSGSCPAADGRGRMPWLDVAPCFVFHHSATPSKRATAGSPWT